MQKRKESSTSRPRARDKAAKEGSDAKRAFENECAQLRRDISALEAKQGKLEEQLGPLRRGEEQVQQSLLAKIKRLEEVKNAQRLGKLPPEVWAKVLDELGENDLFSLALSCRFFRQKQKELVARKGQNGPESGKPRLALKTNLKQKRNECQPASAEYLIFCSKKKVPGNYWYSFHERNCARSRDNYIRRLAALHGHLPLLQELLADSESIEADISMAAGEYSLS